MPASKHASIAGCLCSDAAIKATVDAIQIFGGNGYTREYPVPRLMGNAKRVQIDKGTNQIQRVVSHESC